MKCIEYFSRPAPFNSLKMPTHHFSVASIAASFSLQTTPIGTTTLKPSGAGYRVTCGTESVIGGSFIESMKQQKLFQLSISHIAGKVYE